MAGDRMRRGVSADRRSSARFIARVIPGARVAPIPGFMPLALPAGRARPPAGPEWVHEIRFDGSRIEAQCEAGRPRLYDRDGIDRTARFARIAAAVRGLPVNRIVLDGIVIVQDQKGRSDPAGLTRDIAAGRQDRLVYYAFDLLHLDGFDLGAAPLVERKRVLAALLAEAGKSPIAYSQHLEVDGREFLASVTAMGLGGIVSKRRDSPYTPGRTADWVTVGPAAHVAPSRDTAASPVRKKREKTMQSDRPLLIIDGNSFAHRAYHALPKTIRREGNRGGGAIVGFANYLLRFYETEKPRAVLVGWDTLAEPNWRAKLFASYQGGRVFDAELLDQLDALPELVAACGFANGKAAGYEADDFLAAAVAAEERRGGTAVVASGDRDAFQLASPSTVILHPVRGGEMARIGPAEVRERYGVEPRQVPDFIALRGDPSDKIPGARGVGAKGAATLLSQYATLDNALAAGRFAGQAEDLRLYRKIAAMDAAAPLPRLPDQTPTWDRGAALARDWGLKALAERLAKLAETVKYSG